MSKSLKVLLTLLCFVFVGIFIISGYQLVSTLGEYKAAQNKYEEVSKQFVNTAPKPTPAPVETGEAEVEEPEVETSPIEVDFAALLSQNTDVRGWLYCEGTVLNYPLVQGQDNDFYLDHLVDKSWNPSGTLFMDYHNAPDFSSHNTIIYGHNMNDGSMLHMARKYVDQAYYDEHPVMYLNTTEKNYKIELFSGYVTESESDAYTISFPDEQSYLAYIDKILRRSNFDSPVEPTATDRIVTFSTCTYEYENARYVLHGRLVPLGVQEEPVS